METSKSEIFGHKPGLFLLFFTEMWERFSYYGMRALLVLFLVSELAGGGWGWDNADALKLYALYTGLVYITPILGGILADKVFGHRGAVLIGAALMTLGHGSMALETEATFYIGLGLLIFGNGFFKPNISSIVGQIYKDEEKKKDAAYTIFYMGINAGAFLGILLCGYIGEKVGWGYGFGLAGIFMLLGMLMFWFGQGIFEKAGLLVKLDQRNMVEVLETVEREKKEQDSYLEEFDEVAQQKMIDEQIGDKAVEQKNSVMAKAKELFVKRIVNDRLLVISLFSIFTIFFWMAFEQAGGSMTIFAKDFTNRILSGGYATGFTIINTILTVAPLAIVTYVLFRLFGKTFKKYPLANVSIGVSFILIWIIAGWMLMKEFNMKAYEVTYNYNATEEFNDSIVGVGDLNTASLVAYINGNGVIPADADEIKIFGVEEVKPEEGKEDAPRKYVVSGKYRVDKQIESTLRIDKDLADGSAFSAILSDGKLKYMSDEDASKFKAAGAGSVIRQKTDETEVPASWFGILNSFFIIAFAPIFSKIWESRFNPSGPVKFAIGLILLGLGFGVLAMGSMGIEQGAADASVSMLWLVVAYLMHTLGELCISPVGLSYVSKLAPMRLVGLMFGIWFGATALANYLAGWTGSMIDKISDEYGLATFFLIYTAIPIAAGLIMWSISKWIGKKMHGIK